MRHFFWSKIPNREVRRAKIETIIQHAGQAFKEKCIRKEIDPSDFPKGLCFDVDGVSVCEKAFANALGVADDKGAVSKVWRDEVRAFSGMNDVLCDLYICMCCW